MNRKQKLTKIFTNLFLALTVVWTLSLAGFTLVALYAFAKWVLF